MNDKPTIEELTEAQEHFGLASQAAIEKDWFVIRALAAILTADHGSFRLIFEGGTALARAHRVIDRMSEDIDLKIISIPKQPRSAYRRLRGEITKALLAAGFEFDPEDEQHCRSMWESEYLIYQLPYHGIAGSSPSLKPRIKIELSAWPMRREPVTLRVASFVSEALGRSAEIEAIMCSDLTENAAEKLVALTRRAGAQIAGLTKGRDPTLVRHVYDLYLLERHVDIRDVALLAAEIMKDDAENRGNRFPAYRDAPLRETLRAIEGIVSDKEFSIEYEHFVANMVYGDIPPYSAAITTLATIEKQLRSGGDN